MSHQDQVFFRTFVLVLAGLAILAVIFLVLARGLSHMTGPEPAEQSMQRQAENERIAPVGRVVTGEKEAAGEPAGGTVSGDQIVTNTCAACHQAGAGGAPKLGEKGDWEPRLSARGVDGLLQTVIQGKGIMPPRGGGDYTDEQLRAAVITMLEQSGLESEAGSAEAASSAPDTTSPAGGAEAGTEQAADSAKAAPSAAPDSETLKVGRKVFQSTCQACHGANSAIPNSPKVGDQAAWAQRAEKGMDGMLDIAVNGKGAMPPRGGGSFSEQELEAAIRYMLHESDVR